VRARAYEWCVRSMLSRVARYGADWFLTHAAVSSGPVSHLRLPISSILHAGVIRSLLAASSSSRVCSPLE